MSSRVSAGSLAVAAAAAFLATVSAQTPASHAYVQASRVAVRGQPSATAAVVDYLTTNADVEIEERTGDWCRVRSGTIRGFMACRTLGGEKLTVEAIDAKLREPTLSPRDALDWESRGFWVSPSLVRFEAVGYRMEKTLLTPAMRHAEQMTEGSTRPANAEFDAMKRRLEKGIVASDRAPAREIPNEPLTSAMKRVALPQIRPSFFRADEPRLAIALRPFTLGSEGRLGPVLADTLSAVHGVSIRVRVASPVRFAYFGAYGVWDISRVGVTFDKEVTVNGIAASGTPVSVRFSSLLTPVGNDSCSGSNFDITPIKPTPGWRSAIVAWVGKPAPGKATVVSRRVGGSGKYDKLVIETVDLDGDGVPDFSLWAGLEPPGIETETFWKAVFGNVGGKWELLAFSQEADCT